MHEVLKDVLDRVIGPVPGTDKVRLVLDSPTLQQPISVPFQSRQDLDVNTLMSHVEKVVQSNEQFELNDDMNLNIYHVSLPQEGIFINENAAFHLINFFETKNVSSLSKMTMNYAWLGLSSLQKRI